ncbi:MAG: acetylesterase [Rubrobacter sp.]
MDEHYEHLGPFSSWVEQARRRVPLYPPAPPGPEMRERVRDLLGFSGDPEEPADVRVERTWERDGLLGEEVSWSVGYGPRTRSWVLKPASASGPLPGVLALHGHDGFKLLGKEKIADGPGDPSPVVVGMRESMYGGLAFPNVLAREGFVVLAHDAFLWGSRRFPLESMPERTRSIAEATRESWVGSGEYPSETALYNAAAFHHEHLVEKYCALLGTTLAGVVSHEDRMAVSYLLSRPDVVADNVGCAGLSGGGCRAALLQATCDEVEAAVIVGMMSTYEHLLDHNVEGHTWMFLPYGLARIGDWPDLAACRAPSPLMVQYDRGDDLFALEGMLAAHRRLTDRYREAGDPEAYTGEFYDGPHKFDAWMQESAFAWLKAQLAG